MEANNLKESQISNYDDRELIAAQKVLLFTGKEVTTSNFSKVTRFKLNEIHAAFDLISVIKNYKKLN